MPRARARHHTPRSWRLLTSTAAALVIANARYWPTVAPLVDRELYRWRKRAQQITDPPARALALAKLDEEHFNAQVAATVCTQAPRQLRRPAVEAIVALEVMYDYLDGLTERPLPHPIDEGEHLYLPFTEAFTDRDGPTQTDDPYLTDLAVAVNRGFLALPSATAIMPTARASARRCAQAQVRVHAAAQLGDGSFRAWAEREADKTSLGWREFLAGAMASVLAVHVLIALACNPHVSSAEAEATDAAYLSISAISTLLDSLVDYEQDRQEGKSGMIGLYEDHDRFVEGLAKALKDALQKASGLPRPAYHQMTLAGVVAYYVSAPSAQRPFARPVLIQVHAQLGGILGPPLAVMRAWRAAKRLRRRLRTHASTESV